jgi:hypothetical protein
LGGLGITICANLKLLAIETMNADDRYRLHITIFDDKPG